MVTFKDDKANLIGETNLRFVFLYMVVCHLIHFLC